MPGPISDLDARARQVLEGNDRGGYTVPTAGLYPYQWNWDSVFAALGFATFDEHRAWREIETLFEAQWPNGMVPHIIFRGHDPDYFPGPEEWGTDGLGLTWPSSGISQPPVAASAIRWIRERSTDPDAADNRLRALNPRLNAWHRWWHDARDPDRLGIMVVSHPWESGRDNLPDWDEPGQAIDTSGVGGYRRRDTAHVDPHMRPNQDDYDRYMALVYFGRDRQWDQARIAAESPFWVADVGVTSILLRAERDLLALARSLGETDIARQTGERLSRMEAGYERFWSQQAGAYASLDLRTQVHATHANAATLLCFYAGAGNNERRRQMVDLVRRWADDVTYLTPSFDPASPLFEPLRYWRGPVWATINCLIGIGLDETGHTDLANRIRNDTARLIEKAGFAEYYSAVDGQGAGGGAFSWTAAVWLAWASPTTTLLNGDGARCEASTGCPGSGRVG